MRAEHDILYKSRMMKQEIQYARSHQLKLRAARLAENQRLAEIAEAKRKIDCSITIQRVWRGYKVFNIMYTTYRGILRLQALYRCRSTLTSFLIIKANIIKCQAFVRMVFAVNKYRQYKEAKLAEELRLATIAEENNIYESVVDIQRVWRGYKAYTHMFIAYRGLLRLQARFRSKSACSFYCNMLHASIVVQKNTRRSIAQHQYTRVRNMIIGLQLRFRERKADERIQNIMRSKDERLLSALAREKEIRDNYRDTRHTITYNMSLNSISGPINKNFELNQLDFRSLLTTNRDEYADDEEDDDLLGIFTFQEKEYATVLFSMLNSLIVTEKWNRAVRRIEGVPEECSLWIVENDSGRVWKRLALHAAMRKNPTKEVVAAILEAYPDSASHKDNLGALPLHYAAEYGASVEVLRELVKVCPRGIIVKDRDGRIPIDRLNIRDHNTDYSDTVSQLLADEWKSYKKMRAFQNSSSRSLIDE